MTKKQIIEEFLKERDLVGKQMYKILPQDFAEFFLNWLEEKGYYAKKENS